MNSIKTPNTALIVLLCFSLLTACSDDSSDSKNSNTSTTSTTTTSSTTSQADAGQDTQDEDTTPDVVEDTGPPPTPESFVAAVDNTRYEEDLRFAAQIRPPGSDHWQATQDRCASVLESAGFDVERHNYGSGINVIGTRTGTTRPNELVVISAHYDHIENCAGADDNASGYAGVLEAARVYSNARFERTLVLACWDEEEAGLVGARAWTERAATQGVTVHASYVLESIGFSNTDPNSQDIPFGFDALFPDAAAAIEARNSAGDFIAVIGDDINPSAGNDFIAHAEAIGLPAIQLTLSAALRSNPALSDLRRSDHDTFWAQNWPGIMLTDTANFRNPNYHCFGGPDTVETLDIPFAAQIVRATIGAAAQQAIPAP